MSRLTSDRAYLEGLISGSVDRLGSRVFLRLKPMFARYPEGTNMYSLVVRAADAYGDAAVAVAHFVLADTAAIAAIEKAQQRAKNHE